MKTSITILFLACLTVLAPPSPQTESVNLSWVNDPDPLITSVKIYWGQGPPNIPGWNGTNTTYRVYTNFSLLGVVSNATVTGLSRNVRYYFAVTSVSSNLYATAESDYSNEVFKDVPKKPSSPTNLKEQ